jgi:hypothetical protein
VGLASLDVDPGCQMRNAVKARRATSCSSVRCKRANSRMCRRRSCDGRLRNFFHMASLDVAPGRAGHRTVGQKLAPQPVRPSVKLPSKATGRHSISSSFLWGAP